MEQLVWLAAAAAVYQHATQDQAGAIAGGTSDLLERSEGRGATGTLRARMTTHAAVVSPSVSR